MHLSDISKHLAEYLDVVVVEEDAVNYRSRDGYRLLYVIEQGQTMRQPQAIYDSQTGRHVQPDAKIFTRPLFVMGKVRDQLVEEMRQTITGLEAAAKGATATNDRLTEEAKAFATTKKILEDQVARVSADRDNIRETSRQYADRLRKMETDLARVRTHVGAKVFDEAISMTKED